MAEVSNTAPAPRRLLGFPSVLALVIGTFIGSGIFLLPQQLAPLGWNGVFGWLVTIAGAVAMATLFGVLARAIPKAAGPYAYVGEAFGPLPAYIVAWAYWVSIWVGNAAIAIAAISYLSIFVPVLASSSLAGAAGAIGLLALLTAVNCLSLKAGGGLQLVTVALKLVPILAVILLAGAVLARGTPTAIPSFDPALLSLGAINGAATITLWALLGFEAASIAARNVRRPEVVVPRATVIGTLIVGLIYLAVALPVSLFLPAAEVAASPAPFGLFMERFGGPMAGEAIALFAAISVVGALNGLILISGELPLAMARAGRFPHFLTRTASSGIAVRAILLSSLLSALLILANASRGLAGLFAFMALLGTIGALVLYLFCAAAVLRLQRRGGVRRSAALSATAVFGLVYAFWALYGAGMEASLWGAALMGFGLLLYAVMGRVSPRPVAAREDALPEPAASVSARSSAG
jgi:APA family basic amino acid/polyamine antiporter